LDTRQSELTVPYFHVVFTLPDSINVLAMQDPRLVYDLLFESAWATLKSFGQRNPNWDDCGFLHLGTEPVPAPHLHCIVPGGGVDKMAIGRI
jgi:hypothetical protein